MYAPPKQIQIVDTLQESKRFLVEKVIYNGVDAVLKRAKTPEMIVNLQKELEAYEIYALMVKDKSCPFSIAEVLDSGANWILMSHLEGQPMSELMNGHNEKNFLEQLAKIMAFCDDKANVSFNGVRMGMTEQALVTQRARSVAMIERLSLLDALDLTFLKQEIKDAAKFYEQYSPRLETSFVNVDLTPEHVMINGKSSAIFDFELARIMSPRFADVINTATKLAFITGDIKRAQDFMDIFWRAKVDSGESHKLQLKTLIYRRCTGFTDELLTEPNQLHNTSLTMTPEFANNISNVIEWAKSFK